VLSLVVQWFIGMIDDFFALMFLKILERYWIAIGKMNLPRCYDIAYPQKLLHIILYANLRKIRHKQRMVPKQSALSQRLTFDIFFCATIFGQGF
jgi:hypothetical protein